MTDKNVENYQNVINMLESTTKLNGGKATLACDDTFLNWVVTLNDMNPAITGDPGKQTIVDAFKAQGQTFSGTLISVPRFWGVFPRNYKSLAIRAVVSLSIFRRLPE